MEAIAYLITISSSSIDSLCDSCSACLLPTVHPGNMPSHSNRSYTLAGGSRLAAGSSIFTILHFYLGRSRTPADAWQIASAYTVSWNTDQVLYLPWTIAYAAEQLHQQMPGRSHPHI